MSEIGTRIGLSRTAGVEDSVRKLAEGLARVACVAAPPLLRIALALPFFRSGLTRWDGFLSLSPSTTYLFEEEFKLHLFGDRYHIPDFTLVAHLTAFAELALPVLLVFGLATRFAALGLLAMTAVIQLVVPDGWANFHLPWAAMALAILGLGAGPLSVDHLIDRFLGHRKSLGFV